MRYTKNLTFLTVGYDQLAGVFPLLVAAPRYFLGAITLGVLSQIGNAFGRVQETRDGGGAAQAGGRTS